MARGRAGKSDGGRGGSAPPVRLHIENWYPRLHELFSVTPKRYAAARRRHPELAARLRATIGTNFERFERDIRSAELLICPALPTEDLARKAPRLRWIHCTGAGIDRLLPLDWLPPGVTLTNNSGVHEQKAGEFAITAILMLNHGVPRMVTHQRQAAWTQVFTTPIAGKTLAIVGVGRMGGAAARHAKRFGLRVIGLRRSGRPHRYVDEMFGPAGLDRMLARADFLLVTLPLTSATRGLIGRRELGKLKRGAGVVNFGRAGVMDYRALAARLRRGELGGAVLDVFDPEPLPSSSPLWGTPNLIISPHCSSDDLVQYIPLTLDLFFENFGRYLAGRPLRNKVRRSLEY